MSTRPSGRNPHASRTFVPSLEINLVPRSERALGIRDFQIACPTDSRFRGNDGGRRVYFPSFAAMAACAALPAAEPGAALAARA